MIPEEAKVSEPFMVQYLIVLFDASLMNRNVEVFAVDDVLELMIAKSIDVPVAFTRPSMVTLSAPFKSISGAAMLPVIDFPELVG